MTYFDQFPGNLKPGDVITLTTSGKYTLPQRIRARISVRGAMGGNGQTLRSSNYITANGGAGAHGGLTEGNVDLSGDIIVNVGYAGSTYPVDIVTGAGSSYTGASGVNGGETAISDDLGVLLTALGGSGGSGGFITLSSGGAVISSRDGSTGLPKGGSFDSSRVENGTVTVGGSTSSNGQVVITVISTDEPPSAPGSIDYGTPRASKPLEIGITPAVDPD